MKKFLMLFVLIAMGIFLIGDALIGSFWLFIYACSHSLWLLMLIPPMMGLDFTLFIFLLNWYEENNI